MSSDENAGTTSCANPVQDLVFEIFHSLHSGLGDQSPGTGFIHCLRVVRDAWIPESLRSLTRFLETGSRGVCDVADPALRRQLGDILRHTAGRIRDARRRNVATQWHHELIYALGDLADLPELPESERACDVPQNGTGDAEVVGDHWVARTLQQMFRDLSSECGECLYRVFDATADKLDPKPVELRDEEDTLEEPEVTTVAGQDDGATE